MAVRERQQRKQFAKSDAVIKSELVGCVLWLLGYGMHRLQVDSSSSVYTLCSMEGDDVCNVVIPN